MDILRHPGVRRGGVPVRLPEGRGGWHPLGAAQDAALKKAYEDDLFRPCAGADGLARLAWETGSSNAETQARGGQPKRGQEDGIEERHMA